jgi:hypothetical protein
MSINFSNGRPVYQHRRSQSSGLNAEGQPQTDQIEEGEIAMNLSSRKLYSKRPTVTRDSDGTSDTLIITKTGTQPANRMPGSSVSGQQFQNGGQIRVIARRLLDSDEAGNNITIRLRQSYFLDSDAGERPLSNAPFEYPSSSPIDARFRETDSDAYSALANSTKIKRILHDSDGTVAIGVAPQNAAGGGTFGGGIVDITFSISADSDFEKEGIAKAIRDAVNSSSSLSALDSTIKAEIDNVDKSIVYIYGGDKLLEVETTNSFVNYVDQAVTPLYKFIPNDSDTFFFVRDSENASMPTRVEVTFIAIGEDETTPRTAAVGETLENTDSKGIDTAANSLLLQRKSVILKNMTGLIGGINQDQFNTSFKNQFKLRPADFTGAEEIITLNAVAIIGNTPPSFDVDNGSLWVDNRFNKDPRYDAVDSETHIISVNMYGRGGVADPSSIPAGTLTFNVPYGPGKNRDSDDADSRINIAAGDTAATIAEKIYNVLDNATDQGWLQTVISDSEGLIGNDGLTIGTETHVGGDLGTAGFNVVKVSYDSEHDSDLFGMQIYLQEVGDSDGSTLTAADGLNRHRYIGLPRPSDSDSDADFHGIVIEIKDRQKEKGRVFAGRQAAELYYLDATLIDDPTAQAKALSMSSAERTNLNIVRHSAKTGNNTQDSDGAFRYAEWRLVSSTSVLSPQSLELTVGGATFTNSQTLNIEDVNGTVLITGSLLQ